MALKFSESFSLDRYWSGSTKNKFFPSVMRISQVLFGPVGQNADKAKRADFWKMRRIPTKPSFYVLIRGNTNFCLANVEVNEQTSRTSSRKCKFQWKQFPTKKKVKLEEIPFCNFVLPPPPQKKEFFLHISWKGFLPGDYCHLFVVLTYPLLPTPLSRHSDPIVWKSNPEDRAF